MNIEEPVNELEKIKEMFIHLKNYGWINDIKREIDVDKAIESIETLLTAYEEEKETSHYIQSQLDIANAKLVEEKEKNKDMSCDLTETRADNIDESTMLKQIKLKLQEKNIPIETLLAEFERLEDLEDDLTTVYLNGVYDGEKKVVDKIKAKIEDLKENSNGDDFNLTNVIMILQSLLEKE